MTIYTDLVAWDSLVARSFGIQTNFSIWKDLFLGSLEAGSPPAGFRAPVE